MVVSPDDRVEVGAVDVCHCEVIQIVVLTETKDGLDISVLQVGHRPCFMLELLYAGFVSARSLFDHPERYRTFSASVESFVDMPCLTAPERFLHPKIVKLLADQRVHTQAFASSKVCRVLPRRAATCYCFYLNCT